MRDALKHKAGATDTHHQECRQCDAFGVAGTNGINGLRQIAQNHRDTSQPATNLKKRTLFHNFSILFFTIHFYDKDAG